MHSRLREGRLPTPFCVQFPPPVSQLGPLTCPPSSSTVVAGRQPETAERQPGRLHRSSQRAPLRGEAHVRTGGFGLPYLPPRPPAQPSQPEALRGMGPIGPKQLSVRTVAKQVLVSESQREGGHQQHRRAAGAAQRHRGQVEERPNQWLPPRRDSRERRCSTTRRDL